MFEYPTIAVVHTASILLFCTRLCTVNAETTYTNEWAVHVDGDVEKASEVARRNGFKFVEEVRILFR